MRRRRFLTASTVVAASPLVTAATPAAVPGAAPGAASAGRGRVRTGAEVLAASGWSDLAGQKVGVVTNPTGVTGELTSIVDEMHGSGTVDVVAVFGPEHGFRGTGQAGDGEGDHRDPRTGIMVYDAHGADARKFATLYDTSGVQTVVFDIQDVGARFYTYIWTMYEAMAGAVGKDITFVVLDRPNPIGGHARGPMLREGFTSGVGKQPIIQQHGMTVGEMARYFDAELLPAKAGGRVAELRVVRTQGWRRHMRYADTGLPWTLPSPNMPTPDTALLYPGTCLFEATNLSEGRGTTRPFELIGVPYADHRWAHALEELDLPGVAFREAYFVPTFSKHVGKTCAGVQVHITDPRRVEAITVATHMIVEARRLYDGFDWRGDGGRWIDLLTGSDRFRTMLAADAGAKEIVAAWKRELADFDRARRPYLLYEG
ncbi:MAG: DUF1343 domain-containing protein [Streptosporangiales bacterium]|nr:DUF1343 domain-containing protein [Streptosporangiales bacterium]